MPVRYSQAVRTARMTAVRNECANGTLEVLSDIGGVLVTYGLSASGGTVLGNAWTLDFDTTSVVAAGSGTATTARIKTASGAVAVDGLTVGVDFTVNIGSIVAGRTVEIGAVVLTHAPVPA
jgi:hypothetical protein